MKYDRYTTVELENGEHYIFDKYVFLGYIGVLLLIFLSFILLNGGLSSDKNIYVKCDVKHNSGWSQPMCENPFYKNYEYCNTLWARACEQETIPNGFTYGKPPPSIMIWFDICVFIGLILATLINHYIWNRWIKFKDLKIKKIEVTK
jgi:hypothetical protein